MRRRQPNQRPPGFRLDFGHPFGNGLIFAGLALQPGSSTFFDSGPRRLGGSMVGFAPPTTGIQWCPALQRMSLKMAGAQYVELPQSVNVTDSGTMCLWARLDETGSYPVLISDGSWDTIREGTTIAWWSGFNCSAGDAGPTVAATASLTNDPSQYYHIAMTWTAGDKVRAYLNGQLAATSSATSVTPVPAFGNRLRIGSNGKTVGYHPTGELSDPMIWSRSLSHGEISLLADPSNVMLSGLVVPPRRRLSKGSGVTGSPQSISVPVCTATATSITFLINSTITCPVCTSVGTSLENQFHQTVPMPVVAGTATAITPATEHDQSMTAAPAAAVGSTIAPQTNKTMSCTVCSGTGSAIAPNFVTLTRLTFDPAVGIARVIRPNILINGVIVPFGSSNFTHERRVLELGG